jgi:hypothetical protein
MHDVPARTMLLREIESRGGNKAQVSREIGVSAPSLLAWVCGQARPEYVNRVRIERWSQGRVPQSSWLTPDEFTEVFSEVNRGF